jgi:proteasome lid subunit RPN8/RPN11
VKRSYPKEAFGLLFGNIKEIPKELVKDDFLYRYEGIKFRCIQPDKSSAISFLMENIEKLGEIIVKESNLSGKKMHLLSIFHSHPSGTSPSNVDMKQMKDLDDFSSISHKSVSKVFKNRIWLIMDSHNYNLDGYIFLENKLHKVEVTII